MVGSAICRVLQANQYDNILKIDKSHLDLRRQTEVEQFFERNQPEYVFLAAAKVGGILANNTYRAQFLYDNVMIASNVVNSAHLTGVKKLLLLGSSCIYPKHSEIPIAENALLTGILEPTNEPYALAKITGIKLCETYRAEYGCNFISVMPCNMYGPNDNYDPLSAHVLPSLIRKIHEAHISGQEEVVLWGTGKPMREFLHVDDFAQACFFLMKQYSESGHINVGTGEDVSIIELANLIKDIVGYKGTFRHDLSKPDGTYRKVLDVSRIKALGWAPRITLREGIERVYKEEFL